MIAQTATSMTNFRTTSRTASMFSVLEARLKTNEQRVEHT